jgi:hypothetical protein
MPRMSSQPFFARLAWAARYAVSVLAGAGKLLARGEVFHAAGLVWRLLYLAYVTALVELKAVVIRVIDAAGCEGCFVVAVSSIVGLGLAIAIVACRALF